MGFIIHAPMSISAWLILYWGSVTGVIYILLVYVGVITYAVANFAAGLCNPC